MQLPKWTSKRTHHCESNPFRRITHVGGGGGNRQKRASNSYFNYSNRIRIVGARERSRAAGCFVRIDDPDNRSVSTSNHQEASDNEDKADPTDHEDPPRSSLSLPLAPIVIEPHETERLKVEECAEQGTNERDEAVKDRNCTRNNVSADDDAEGTAQPHHPVCLGI